MGVPLFGAATAVHPSYDDGNCSARLACRQALKLPGSMLEFSWDSAYWVNSAVAKLAYSDRDNSMPVIRKARADFERFLGPLVQEAEAAAIALYQAGEAQAAVKVLDALAITTSKEATERWEQLW